mmetsp:Transcript_59790/g.192435  ORF Transcript_59790/g.192435 Transcript_59790/m.192435 type:complete len:193 (-) Transcript_59790:71-649(-)
MPAARGSGASPVMASAAGRSGRRSAPLMLPFLALATLAGVACSAMTYVAPAAVARRRQVAIALGAQVLLPQAAALAGDRDRSSMVLGVRRQTMPKILEGYRMLKQEGTVSNEFLETELKPMTNALKSYGMINRLSEAPDKISRKLTKDANIFAQAAKDRDYEKAMDALEMFRTDIPAGVGEFTWDSTLSSDV